MVAHCVCEAHLFKESWAAARELVIQQLYIATNSHSNTWVGTYDAFSIQ